MYYQLSEFYKRDIYLQYAEENSIQYNAFEKGERIEIKSEIFYKVDKIDDYLNNYDVLPTYGTPLVSSKFVKLFKGYEEDVQFLRVNIKDMDGNTNRNFYIPNILKIVPCLDEVRSVIELRKQARKFGSKPQNHRPHRSVFSCRSDMPSWVGMAFPFADRRHLCIKSEASERPCSQCYLHVEEGL